METGNFSGDVTLAPPGHPCQSLWNGRRTEAIYQKELRLAGAVGDDQVVGQKVARENMGICQPGFKPADCFLKLRSYLVATNQ